MSVAVDDERAERLLRRLNLHGDVLHDRVSGRTIALNATACHFFVILQRYGTSDTAITRITSRYGISRDQATSDFTAFLDRIDQGQRCAGSILPGEHHAVIEPTAACNGQCPHCYHSARSGGWPRERIGDILHRLATAGVRSVSVTGGEVFSAPFVDQFFALVNGLEAEGITVASVSTNATFLNEQVRDRVLAVFDGSTVFRISLDAMRPDLLDRIRPGYRHLADPYRPIRDLEAAGFPLVFTTNLWAQEPDDVTEVGDYLRQYRHISAWNLRLAVPVHRRDDGRRRDAARQRHLFPDRPDPRLPLRHYAEILRVHTRCPYRFPIRMGNYLMTGLLSHPDALVAQQPGHPCREDQQLITVKADGRVTQCPILTELDPALANGRIWDDKTQITPGPLHGLHTDTMGCAACPLRPVCGGGCRLYSLAYDQPLDGCDQPARSLLAWMLADPTGLLRTHWPEFHARLRDLLPDGDPELLYQRFAQGWDR
ncbi:MAG: radical SAM protein [Micromonosporaceae bacterium]|nr:radical SAM protein [Micromonosporaceae bacterium]